MGTPVDALISGFLVALASWLPLSPEAGWFPSLVKDYTLFLVPAYMGTTFAVLFYFRDELSRLFMEVLRGVYRAELKYLLFATVFTALIGIPASKFSHLIIGEDSTLINALIGALIVLTALASPKGNPLRELDRKLPEQPSIVDALSAGILQGLALLGQLTRTGAVTLGLTLPGHSARKVLEWGFLVAPAYFVLRLLQLGNWEPRDQTLSFIAFTSAFFTSLLMLSLLPKLANGREKLFWVAFGLIPILVYALEVIG